MHTLARECVRLAAFSSFKRVYHLCARVSWYTSWGRTRESERERESEGKMQFLGITGVKHFLPTSELLARLESRTAFHWAARHGSSSGFVVEDGRGFGWSKGCGGVDFWRNLLLCVNRFWGRWCWHALMRCLSNLLLISILYCSHVTREKKLLCLWGFNVGVGIFLEKLYTHCVKSVLNFLMTF